MTPTERRVADIYADFLCADDVEPEDDVFTLGGDSLMAVRIILELEHDFGLSLAGDGLADARSVRAMARWIDHMRAAAGGPAS